MRDTDQHESQQRPTVLHLEPREGEKPGDPLARTAIAPELGATLALHSMHKKAGGVYDDVELRALLGAMTKATRDEDATGTDRLMSQAVVLDKLFTHLTTVAMQQEYVSGIAPALTLALKAQAQCRTTLQAVSDIRHPRQYIGQQNVGEQYNAAGHQQVNRGETPDGAGARQDRGDARTDSGENRPTELPQTIEGTAHELHPDRGAPRSREGAGAGVETVGAIDGAAHR